MKILPENPLNLPENSADLVLSWASQYTYALLERRDRRNVWLRLEKILDFDPIEQACEDYIKRKSEKNVSHTLRRLVRALFVKVYYGLSLREAEQRIRYDLAVKRFVGYETFEEGCDHTTLERFEVWVARNQPRIYFDTVLKQIDEKLGEEARGKIQYGDTFALEANADPRHLIPLLRELGSKLVVASAHANEMREDEVWEQIGRVKLLGEPDEKRWCHMNGEERKQRLLNTVSGAIACRKTALSLPKEDEDGRIWRGCLEKVLDDNLIFTVEDDGSVTGVEIRPKNDTGDYRMWSAVDPDATFRKHGPEKVSFGYNASVATTDEFVREICAHTGATPDATPIPDLLTAQEEHHDHLPEKMVYDKAAGTAKHVAEVHEATNGKTQLVVELRDYSKRSDLFSPQDFHLWEDELALECPNGMVSRDVYLHPSGKGHTFRFKKAKHGCDTCPLLQKCYKNPDTQPKRDVFISDYRPYWILAMAYMTCDSFRVEMRQRSHVERIIAALVRYNDARRARRRGLVFADYQLKMCATAYNVKKLLKKIDLDPALGEVRLSNET